MENQEKSIIKPHGYSKITANTGDESSDRQE